jgi:hypothetical protein
VGQLQQRPFLLRGNTQILGNVSDAICRQQHRILAGDFAGIFSRWRISRIAALNATRSAGAGSYLVIDYRRGLQKFDCLVGSFENQIILSQQAVDEGGIVRLLHKIIVQRL